MENHRAPPAPPEAHVLEEMVPKGTATREKGAVAPPRSASAMALKAAWRRRGVGQCLSSPCPTPPLSLLTHILRAVFSSASPGTATAAVRSCLIRRAPDEP